MSKAFSERTFAIVDVETTGGSPVTERIIEIGVIRVENGEISDTFQSLVNPECRIPPMITSITGISADDLADAPKFEELAVRVKDMLSGAIFVAHNARFDYGFVRGEFARLGDTYSAKCLCSVRLSRKLSPKFKRHDLSSIIERWNIPCESRHRAYDDAHAVWQLMQIFRKEDSKKFDDAVSMLLGTSTLPQHMQPQGIADLPDRPGAYIFYGPEGETLYVGKSVNIRQRVLSHFASDSKTVRGMNMYQQVASVEARETAGELGALLLESMLIKSLQPLYNKVARRTKKLVLARAISREDGYMSVCLEWAGKIDHESYGDIVGVFKSRSQAKKSLSELARDHGLCERMLSLESGSGACFGSQIGRCSGACAGREDAVAYNVRFTEAFASRKIRTWPYKGAVTIVERREDGSGEAFTIENWCLVESIRFDAEGNREERNHIRDFDYDIYKILARYLVKSGKRPNITLKKDFSHFEIESVSGVETVIE